VCLQQVGGKDIGIVACVAERLVRSVLKAMPIGGEKQQSCKMRLFGALWWKQQYHPPAAYMQQNDRKSYGVEKQSSSQV